MLAQSSQEAIPVVCEFEPQPSTSAAAFVMDVAESAPQLASPAVSVPSPAAFVELERHGNVSTPSSIASPSFSSRMSRPLNDYEIAEALLFDGSDDDDNDEDDETRVPVMFPPYMRLQAEEQMLQEAEAESSSPLPRSLPPNNMRRRYCRTIDTVAVASSSGVDDIFQWRGWLSFKQFIKNKAAAVTIKTYEVCESETGYLWRFEIHADKLPADPKVETEVAGAIPTLVLRLLNGLEYKGHTVWMDNFYNSPALARTLKSKGFDCMGTLRTNRLLVPSQLTDLGINLIIQDGVYGCTSGDVDIILWRDKRRVSLISTYHGDYFVRGNNQSILGLVHDYNLRMGEVNKKDQMLASYQVERKREHVSHTHRLGMEPRTVVDHRGSIIAAVVENLNPEPWLLMSKAPQNLSTNEMGIDPKTCLTYSKTGNGI
ncbi:PiggyBac transposable element-derived protein 4 [Eumeta japonica]|uniref:PiggyBac transposable element-derived protein 4 n=1 Tax=Eumeta variegata TaxID=151549 RepID=A0A4C1UHH0_EUMVA|nr:PiggyBac transposable element-derived protein 4 [Eumeta japonica]